MLNVIAYCPECLVTEPARAWEPEKCLCGLKWTEDRKQHVHYWTESRWEALEALRAQKAWHTTRKHLTGLCEAVCKPQSVLIYPDLATWQYPCPDEKPIKRTAEADAE